MSSWDADDVQVRCVVLERIVDVADVLLLRDCRLHRQLPHLRHYGKGAHSHTRLYRERREREVMFFFFFTNQEKTEERVHTSDRTSRAGTR